MNVVGRYSGLAAKGNNRFLRVYFSGIHTCVRKLLASQIGKLKYRFKKTGDAEVKAELDRLPAELAALPEQVEVRRAPGGT